MELLHGKTLEQRLRRGRLELPLLIDIAIALSEALDVAHGVHIVHRDIKPANVILSARGPKLLDFGLAKPALLSASAVAEQSTMAAGPLVTDPGSTVGTIAYMSPEQLRAEDLDTRSDLFSFGVVLYEMATGRRAFAGATGALIAVAILQQDPPQPRELRPELPERLQEIVMKAIEKDRELRYQRASDINAELQRVQRDLDAARGGAAATPELTARWKPVVPAVAALALLAAGGYVMSHRRPALTNRDTIVLADFVNRTGDPVFDGTLRQGLAVQLEQSPFLSLVSEQRLQRTLAQMGQPTDAPLTATRAQEICERTSSAAFLEGSIASLGSMYVLGLRATDCRTGDLIDEQQIQAPRKEDV